MHTHSLPLHSYRTPYHTAATALLRLVVYDVIATFLSQEKSIVLLFGSHLDTLLAVAVGGVIVS